MVIMNDLEWPILCDLLRKVQKSHAAKREGSFNSRWLPFKGGHLTTISFVSTFPLYAPRCLEHTQLRPYLILPGDYPIECWVCVISARLSCLLHTERIPWVIIYFSDTCLGIAPNLSNGWQSYFHKHCWVWFLCLWEWSK